MSTRVLFFGVATGTGGGHFLYAPRYRIADRRLEESLPEPLRRLDGVWTAPSPRSDEQMRNRHRERDPEVQGRAFIHYVEGWTIVAWWDRSEDKRGACNANFLAEGRRSFVEMLVLAREHFPHELVRMESAYPIALAGADLAPDGDDAAADAFVASFDGLHPQVRSLVLRRLRTRRLENP